MPKDILDKFTTHLKSVLAKSYSLAVETGSPTINPEHLLLALLMQKGSVGGETLRKVNMSAEEVRRVLHVARRDIDEDGGGDEDRIEDDMARLTAESKRAIEKAVLTANVHEHKYVGTEHLLAGLLQIDSPTISALLTDQVVDIIELKEQVETILKSTSKFPEITETFEIGKAPKGMEEDEEEEEPVRKPQKGRVAKTPALDFFSVDLTDPEIQKKIDPVIGRDKEVERLIQILSRRTKNNPVLLGEPGVGKTAIIEGLAKQMLHGDVPDVLKDKRIVSLDIGLMLAGTIYRGEFEGRIKQVMDEVGGNPDIILFIDELHNIMGTGSTTGSLDAANILKPALARGELRCIGATTLAEYKKDIEGDGALERRFQPIIIDPPSQEATKKILKGLKDRYEDYHGVKITDEAIDAAVTFSERYITDRHLPDKALDLLDEAAACVKVANTRDDASRQAAAMNEELGSVQTDKEKAVENEDFVRALKLKTKEKKLEQAFRDLERSSKEKAVEPLGEIGRMEIAEVVSRATGIPASDLMATEKARLLKLEERLKECVIGQDEAIKEVSELVRRAKAGISNPTRPLASMLFLGPSGVGKTELAKTLAATVFHDPKALVRIDMSEFSEGFNMSKLVGAPAGYVGYKESTKLTDIIKRKPYSLVLFDEIEKAHDDVHNLLLQILEDGHITDATGRKIDFKNAMIVMTSNVGAKHGIEGSSIGFTADAAGDLSEEDIAEARNAILKDLEDSFRPEFLNRIDKTVVFRPLSRRSITAIVNKQIRELTDRLKADCGIVLSITPKAAELIAETSWDPKYGARGVRRQVQDLVENPLAKELIADRFKSGDMISISTDGSAVIFVKRKTHAGTAQKQNAQ